MEGLLSTGPTPSSFSTFTSISTFPNFPTFLLYLLFLHFGTPIIHFIGSLESMKKIGSSRYKCLCRSLLRIVVTDEQTNEQMNLLKIKTMV